jgi:4-amino-4-deoxy-L-arabinose transferase-like glycosyltransferase
VRRFANKPIFACLALVLVAAAALFFRLGALPLSGADEPRYARIAEEMERGGFWITPILEGKPWLEKPPLYYWMTIPFFSIFGVSETTARLGPALAGLIAVLAVWWLGTKLWTRMAGFLSALILLSSLGFAGYARAASTDMPMTCCLTVALAILAATAAESHSPVWRLYAAYGCLALAVLAKGPVAVVLAVGTCALFWCLDERGGILSKWRPIMGLVIVGCMALPWFWLAFRQNGFAFIAFFFINHNLARYVSDLHHHSQPFYYYLPVLAGLMIPWTGWILLLFPESPRQELRRWRQWRPETVFLICWVAFPLGFFSLSNSKLAGYILPSLPPLALLLGRCLAERCDAGASQFRNKPAAWTYLTISLMAAVAAAVIFQRTFDHLATGLILALVAAVPAFFAFRAALGKRWEAVVGATLAQGVLAVVMVTVLGFPVLGKYLSTQDLARQAVSIMIPGEPITTYRFFDHTLHYYTGYRIAAELENETSLRRFAAAHGHFLTVTEAARVAELLDMKGFSVSTLGIEGRIRLLRIAVE